MRKRIRPLELSKHPIGEQHKKGIYEHKKFTNRYFTTLDKLRPIKLHISEILHIFAQEQHKQQGINVPYFYIQNDGLLHPQGGGLELPYIQIVTRFSETITNIPYFHIPATET